MSLKCHSLYNGKTHRKNNCLVLSVNVMPCCDTLKCTVVGPGSGLRWYNEPMALRTASGPVSDSVSHVYRYSTLHAAPWVMSCCWAGECWCSVPCIS